MHLEAIGRKVATAEGRT